MEIISDFINNIIYLPYTTLFLIDAALFLLAALGVGMMVFAKRKIKKHMVKEAPTQPPIRTVPAVPQVDKLEAIGKPAVKKAGLQPVFQNINMDKAEENVGENTRGAVSLDDEYARENGLIVCKYCETINNCQNTVCCACGNKIAPQIRS